jgi:hypothetical protein
VDIGSDHHVQDRLEQAQDINILDLHPEDILALRTAPEHDHHDSFLQRLRGNPILPN